MRRFRMVRRSAFVGMMLVALALMVVTYLSLRVEISQSLRSCSAKPTLSKRYATLMVTVFAQTIGASSSARQIRTQTFQPKTLQQMIAAHQLASTVQVLNSQSPSVIIQFPLFPSGVKKAFPNASGVVTIVQGNPEVSLFETVTVDVQNMPPNDKFTVFFTELSAKPFGNAEYVGDVITRGDGSGESVFHLITFVAFAADNRNAGTSQDQSGTASGIQLEHVGLWFDGLPDARVVLQNPNLTGTPFDGGHGALHAGPQALTDGQTLPVI